ncbi:hypothetical protein BDZ91DRAFT_751297 [Kalaharituber pfeilii]|nr:hypothetical protein BDZ91DRAFT_751297 [Kalaharituber pfeilii]
MRTSSPDSKNNPSMYAHFSKRTFVRAKSLVMPTDCLLLKKNSTSALEQLMPSLHQPC